MSDFDGTDLLLAALGGLAVGVVGTMVLGRGTAQAAPRPAAGLVPWGVGAGGTVDPAGAVKTNPYGYLAGKGAPVSVYREMPRAPLQVQPMPNPAAAWLSRHGLTCVQWRQMTAGQRATLASRDPSTTADQIDVYCDNITSNEPTRYGGL